MFWSHLTDQAGHFLDMWWPRVLIVVSVLAGVWKMLGNAKQEVVVAVVKAGVVGKEQDRVEIDLLKLKSDMIDAMTQDRKIAAERLESQKAYYEEKQAAILNQMTEIMAPKDQKILELEQKVTVMERDGGLCVEECRRLTALVAVLESRLELVAAGEMAALDRRQARSGTEADRL